MKRIIFTGFMFVVILALALGVGAGAKTLPEHRIGARIVGGDGEFFDHRTGAKFVPRGNNYIRLAMHHPPALNAGSVYHSTFDPGEYDRDRAQAALNLMSRDGYNSVRVFIDEWCVVEQNGSLSDVYLRNLADFLRLAKEHGLYVFLAGFPPITGYADKIPHRQDIHWPNITYLTPGGIECEQRFWRDLILGLADRGAPLEYVAGYMLRNEAFYWGDSRPFTLTTGLLTTANGKTYDMADHAARQRMMDENLIHWFDQVRAAILKIDLTALVGIGFFEPQEPNPSRKGDTRLIRTGPMIWKSTADFIDLHPYPGIELTLAQYMENFELDGYTKKPLLMGEFGTLKRTYLAPDKAALALQDWQVESCRYGFDGWLLWTWDTEEQPEFWTALSEDGVINRVLAPKTRPDPGQRVAINLSVNAALGKKVKTSQTYQPAPAGQAVDGKGDTWWSAGGFAPQWITIDLGKPTTVSQIRLMTTQDPPGETIHRLYIAAGHLKPYRLLCEFRGVTRDSQILVHTPAAPLADVRLVKVVTEKSPSWVGWREIEIITREQQQ